MRKRILINDCYIPFLNAQQKIQIFYGGSGSGKSFFISQRVIYDVTHNNRNYLIVRKVGNTIKNTVYNQIVKTIISMGLREQFTVNKSNYEITCNSNGRQILFGGLDDVEKLKSITPLVGVLTDIWIEEATEAEYSDFKQLEKRIRGVEIDSNGKVDNVQQAKRVILSFNPIMQTHWIYKEFFGVWDDSKRLYKGDDLLILKTTHIDNHFMTAGDHAALENEKDRYYYNVYTLGNWGMLGAVIFKNWRVEDLSAKISTFDKIYNGLDFGFIDPMAYIKCAVDQDNKKIYIIDEIYRSQITTEELIPILQPKIEREYLYCDSAEPDRIAVLTRAGIRALPVKKGKNSIIAGIDFLKGYEIIIDIHCINFKNEIQAYQWQKDKFDNTIERPVDRDNHLIDALRYATETIQIYGKINNVTKRF